MTSVATNTSAILTVADVIVPWNDLKKVQRVPKAPIKILRITSLHNQK